MYRHIFTPDANGKMPTLGDVMLKTKVGASGNFPYFLIGDPSLTLAYPKHEIVANRLVNAANEPIDTIRALQTVTLSGYIKYRGRNQVKRDFNGRLQVTLYDKSTSITVRDGSCVDIFRQTKSVIFNGVTQVDTGYWTITFQLPLDINYAYGAGAFSFYAQQQGSIEDANGIKDQGITIGGSVVTSIDDSPPQVKLYMNDFSFKSGGIVGNNPTFLARVSDNTGINVSLSGIGHEMIGKFSFAPSNAVVMNSFYVSDLGKPNQGTVRYPLQDLKPGSYKVTFKVWDLQNNSAIDSITFRVLDNQGDCPTLARPIVTPNPVITQAVFSIDNNQVGKPLRVEVDVFDVLGRQVGSVSKEYLQAPARLGEGLAWDIAGGRGLSFEPAMYIYRIKTTSASGCQASAMGRMVINR
jgi:hypothetical protein